MTAAVLRAGRPWALFAASAAVLVAVEAIITGTPAFSRRSDVLAVAVAADLVLGLPLLGWLFLVRPARAPWLALIPLAVAGGVLAAVVLPPDARHPVGALGAVLPVLEAALLVVLVLRARRIATRYRAVRSVHDNACDALEDAIGFVLGAPRAAAAIAAELTMVRYGVAGWFAPTPPPADDEFSYHRRGSYPAVLGVIGLVAVFETIGLHVLLSLWRPMVAWVVTGLGVYGLFWLAGDFHAGRLLPIRVDDAALALRTGLRWRVRVAFAEIVGVHDDAPPPGEPRVAFAFIGAPDFWIELREPIEVRGLLGIRRRSRWLGVAADDPAALRGRL